MIDTLKLQGHTFGIAPMRLEVDALGRPLAFVEALGGIGYDMYALRWEDSTWHSVDHLGYGTQPVKPVPAPAGTHHLIWAGGEEIMTNRRARYLAMNEFAGDRLGRPDTVTIIDTASLKYAAAASTSRRWAAADDYGDLRLLYSDRPGAWIEVPVEGSGGRGVTIGALDDTTALLVWRDRLPGAGILRGTGWALTIAPPMTDLFDAAPLLRTRPSGYWLSWATARDFVGAASYRDGVWSPAESIFCAYLRPEPHYSQSPAEMSSDDGEYPAVSWMAVSSRNGLTSVCVCVPSDSGFTLAENLVGSEGGLSPVVARDRNQDVWVAWQAPSGMGWTHTYTHATANVPTVTGAGGERTIAWMLSEPAPGSWWVVLRAREGQAYEVAARVRANEGLTMSWTDPDPANATLLRYRIRRENLDTQYQWLSEEVLWPVDVPPHPAPGSHLLLSRASANPSEAVVRFVVLNASAGPLDVEVYDLRGRLLLHQRLATTGGGRDTIQVDLASAPDAATAGLYFLRVADSTGRVSPSAKFVFLR